MAHTVLTTLSVVANKLHRFNRLFILLCVICLCLFIGLLAIDKSASHDKYLFVCTLIMSWSLLALLLTKAFAQPLPEPQTKNSLIGRVIVKIKRALLTLFASLFIILTLATIFMTFRLVSFGFYY